RSQPSALSFQPSGTETDDLAGDAGCRARVVGAVGVAVRWRGGARRALRRFAAARALAGAAPAGVHRRAVGLLCAHRRRLGAGGVAAFAVAGVEAGVAGAEERLRGAEDGFAGVGALHWRVGAGAGRAAGRSLGVVVGAELAVGSAGLLARLVAAHV